jgi:transaldolase
MKLCATGAGLPELGACLTLGVCAGITVDAAALATGDARATLAALCAPERLIFVELPPDAVGADPIVRAARELAALGPSIVVRVPFGGDALKALEGCAAAGVQTNSVGCATAVDAHAAARAGAAWITPVASADLASAAALDLVRKMNALVRADDLTARMLVGPVSTAGALVELALVGAHAAFVSPALLREIAVAREAAWPRATTPKAAAGA